jgi:transposase-like protein
MIVIDEIVNCPSCDQLHHVVGGEVPFDAEQSVACTSCGAPLFAWNGNKHCEVRPIRDAEELERLMERRRNAR